jgi:hypothetical protein
MRRRWQPPPPNNPNHIRGVWVTFPTSKGDFEARVTSVDIDGERWSYEATARTIPFACTVETIVLHLGALMVELGLDRPERVSPGDYLTVSGTFEVISIVARNPIRRSYL